MPKARICGVYSVTPVTTKGGQRTYFISGWTEDDRRIRVYEQDQNTAKTCVKELQDQDEQIREARRNGTKAVVRESFSFSSRIITSQARLDDLEAALRLLPKGADGLPDPAYSVEKCVEKALRGGYSPSVPNATLKDVAPLHAAHLEWRGRRPTNDPAYIADAEQFKYWNSRIVELFGSVKVETLAAPGQMESRLGHAGLTPSVKSGVASAMNRLLKWASAANLEPIGEDHAPLHPRYIESYTAWNFGYRRQSVPDILSLPECQALLDEAWRTAERFMRPLKRKYKRKRKGVGCWAARQILLIWCALRPSEIGAPGFRLSDDCTMAYVPEEGTKTGWRNVPIPPNAQILLRILRDRELLFFRTPSPAAMALLRGRAGFPISRTHMCLAMVMGTGRPYGDITCEEAEAWFRERWPLKFEVYNQDDSRHTGGSYYATASQSIPATAMFMGNEPAEVERSYWGRVELSEVPDFYRMLPTVLRGTIDTAQIPMPFWFQSQRAEDRLKEQQTVEQLAMKASVKPAEAAAVLDEPKDLSKAA